MIPTHSFRTSRLVIDNFVPDDITPEYLSWLNDESLMRFSSQRGRNHTPESASVYIEGFLESADRFVAIRLADVGQLVGTATLYWHSSSQSVDIGILIGHPRCGYGTEAFIGLIAGLLSAGVPRVTAGTVIENDPMIAVALRSGMREVHSEDTAPGYRFFAAPWQDDSNRGKRDAAMGSYFGPRPT